MSYKEEFLEKCLILDTETTSKDYSTAEIIETGFVIRENSNWVMFQELHKPINTLIPPVVQSICYITNNMVVDKPSFIDSKEIFQTVVDGFSNGYMVGHNYFYDMKVLQNHGITLLDNSICTWRLSKKLFNKIPEIEATNLPYLRFALELDIPVEVRCHRAGNDSLITGKLLEVLIDLMEEQGVIDKNQPYGPQIMKWSAEPIYYTNWPIGKYKGMQIDELPVDYIMWALKNIDSLNENSPSFDPDLVATITSSLERRGII